MAKILLVDDDPDFVEVTRLILEKNGYEVTTAASGKEGWEKAQSEQPDLILLDVMMETPDEGFQLAYKFRKDPELKSKPIIIITAVGKVTRFKFDKEKDEEFLPVEEYIEKPVKPEVLLEKISKALSG
jgi:two-component system alkaline phosphatase synthesis response regulator PhoP